MNYTIVDYFGYDLSPKERMQAIKQAGFDGVILLWADYFDADYKDFPRYARQAGLYIENAHAPYRQAHTIWENTAEGQEYTEQILCSIKDCFLYGIPTLVMHSVNRTAAFPPNKIGIERFQKIMETAEKFDINIALENQGSPEYLAFVFKNIQSCKLGFCFDSGHANCYSPELDLLELYGRKLMALHLHDNDGKADFHSLPFTGSVDWNKIAGQLNRLHYTGAVALETLNAGFEHVQSPVEFLRIALERARKIAVQREHKE